MTADERPGGTAPRDLDPRWDEIHGFRSPDEVRRFRLWLAEAIEEGALVPVPVGERYSGLTLDERWYRTPAGRTWRFVAPDPPFAGVFVEVAAT